MRLRHPRNRPPSMVSVDGNRVAVDDDGTFELPDGVSRGWVRRFASSYGVDPEELIVDDSKDGGNTPPIIASDATVDEIRDVVADIESADAVRFILEDEREGKARKTAISALETRLEELED